MVKGYFGEQMTTGKLSAEDQWVLMEVELRKTGSYILDEATTKKLIRLAKQLNKKIAIRRFDFTTQEWTTYAQT